MLATYKRKLNNKLRQMANQTQSHIMIITKHTHTHKHTQKHTAAAKGEKNGKEYRSN